MRVVANGLTFEVEVDEPHDTPVRGTVMLTMGLGMQLVAWPESLVRGLNLAGYRTVRYDNRDIGLTSHLDHLGQPTLGWQFVKHKMGMRMSAPYRLQDMAVDLTELAAALGFHRYHLLGVSMGGMISQRAAFTAPDRVASLTSIMSSSGAPGLPGPSADVAHALLQRPASARPDDVVANSLHLFRLISSPMYPEDVAHVQDRLMAGVHRNYHPQGVVRQTLAVLSDTDRHLQLGRITCPTLVIHGAADPLVPLACGSDTAQRIARARFEAIDGMGHDWPPAVVKRWLELLVPHLDQAF